MKLDHGWKGPGDFRRWGPFLSFERSTGTEMRVSWQSKFFSIDRWVEYGENADLGTKKEERVEPTTMHSILLENLKPDTTYYYKISRPEDVRAESVPVYTFTTGPTPGTPTKFNFCITGDMHAAESAAKLIRSMDRNVPDNRFLVNAGDLIRHGGEEESWNEFFYHFMPVSSKFALMNATGNHDTDHPETYAHFLHTFRYPYEDPQLGAYYHFIYGNALFIVLDSDNAGQTRGYQGIVGDEQMDWLCDMLERHALKDLWIFIIMHHQVYSTGEFGMMKYYDLAYRELFDEYHVDGVFYGHDHLFEVYWTGREKDWGGTHYCLVGNAGPMTGLNNRDVSLKDEINYVWKGRTYIHERDGILDGKLSGARNDEFIKRAQVYGAMEPGFTNIEINGDECEMRMWGLENQVYFRDTFHRTGHGKRYHRPAFTREF
ncbi:MAG: metallophosphoesterase [Promethearchaeota archaeon]